MSRILPKVEDLRPIAADLFKAGSISDFDVYLMIGGHVVLFAPSLYEWDRGELARLQREGHRQVYYHFKDGALVEAYKQITQVPSVDERLAPNERIQNITDVAAEYTRTLFANKLTPSTLNVGQKIAEAMVRCIEEDATSITALGQLAHHDQYTYYHSGRVGAYATALALTMGLSDSFSLTELSLGCLLHDVGKARVDLEILNKPTALNQKEREIITQHPRYGIDMVEGAILTAVPKEIILHHHERVNGSGYPDGLNGRQLLAEVKIASFADCFDALTTERAYQAARSHFDALRLIKSKLLNSFEPGIFDALVEILHGRSIDKKAI